MPLLQIVKPPTEKVSPGESHRIEVEESVRVYHFMENEWRLEPKQSFPEIITTGDNVETQCPEPPPKDMLETSFFLPGPPEMKHVSTGAMRNLPLELVRKCVILADLAYCHPQDLLNEYQGGIFLQETETGFPVMIRHAIEDSGSCYIWKSKNDRVVYIGIRGSACLSEIINPQVPLVVGLSTRGRVNRKYRDWCRAIIPFVNEHLKGIQGEFDDVVVTGHGLGAAYSTVMAPVLKEVLPQTKKVSCITFGSPRVGDPEFGFWFREKVYFSYRFITRGDPVSIVPMSGSYLHVADAFAVASRGDVELWPEKINGDLWTFSWPETLYFMRSSRLHHVSEYAERLLRMLEIIASHSRSGGA
jgi:hypothetical protein